MGERLSELATRHPPPATRHVDFLLCEPLTLKPLLVVELDDATHQTPYAQDSDRYKDELFTAAGMPLLRLDHPNIPARRLRGLIEEKLGVTSVQ